MDLKQDNCIKLSSCNQNKASVMTDSDSAWAYISICKQYKQLMVLYLVILSDYTVHPYNTFSIEIFLMVWN